MASLSVEKTVSEVEPELTVVIPVFNEQARIGHRLSELESLVSTGSVEVIVVDGGSRDATVPIAESFSFCRVLRAPRGRASQMNAGARAARGRTLLFLHADVSPPRDALDWIRGTLDEPGIVAGAFRTRTVSDGEPRWSAPWLRLADLRSRYTTLPYGDQAIFLRRETFFEAGGFPDLPLMEDLELSLRLRRLGRIRIVPASVQVSGRRFLKHPLRDTLLVNAFPLLYRLGVSAEKLASLYRDVR